MKFSKTTGCFYPDDIPYKNTPSDLMEVTENDYNAAMSRPSNSTLDVQGGNLVIVPAPPPTLASLKDALIFQIDTDADAIYGAVTGNRAVEYQQSETQAQAFKATNYTGTVPGCVAAWVAANPGKTAKWAADDILATAATWRSAVEQIRTARLGCKAQAMAAADAAALATVRATWAAARDQIRAALGLNLTGDA